MAKALYNPKYLNINGTKTLNVADVKGFVWSHARWDLKVNEMKKFPDDVADAMLLHIDFLQEVTPKNIDDVKKEVAEARYHCGEEGCGFETDTKTAYINHSKTHGKTPEHDKLMGEIQEAAPVGNYRKVKRNILNPEEQEGIPKGNAEDSDHVPWYGEGLERDTV